ncbi:unnamed protein product [Somion occarium]|uniref:Uncharacterized protein n=1 Tax=Somion occarium TaxID=3059160 RepID=A0ABP1CJ29_9APHY
MSSVSSSPISLVLSSTSVSSKAFTQVPSSSASQTFITTGPLPAAPTSSSSSVFVDTSITPANQTAVISAAPASTSSLSLSLSPSSVTSAVSSNAASTVSSATFSQSQSTQLGVPTDSAPAVSISVSSSGSIISLSANPSPAKSLSSISSRLSSASASFGHAIESASPTSKISGQTVTPSTSEMAATSAPLLSSSSPVVTEKNPSTPESQPAAPESTPSASPSKGSSPSSVPSQPASSPSQPAPSPSKPSAEPSTPASSPSSPTSAPAKPSSPPPSSQAPSRPTDVVTPSVTPSGQPQQSPGSVGPSPTVGQSQATAKNSAVSPDHSPPSSQINRSPVALSVSVASIEVVQSSAHPAKAAGTSVPLTRGSAVPSLTPVVQTPVPVPAPADESAVSSQAAVSPDVHPSDVSSVSVISGFSSFRGQANAQTATTTSTITDVPETTLTSPVFVTTTDSNGHISLSEPPVFASIAVSTLPDGQLVSVTHVIANPTGVWGINDNSAVSHGFFANTGAVAGVFLVVGIVVALLIALGCYVVRKKRRRQRIRHSISRPLPYPDNPFEDPRETPSPTQLRFAPDISHRNLIGSGLGLITARPRNLLDDEVDDDTNNHTTIYSSPQHNMPQAAQQVTSRDLAGIGAGVSNLGKPDYNGPFSDYHNHRPTHQSKPSVQSEVGLAITTEQTRIADDAQISFPMPIYVRPPSAQSSPSIYPASLPPVPTEEAEHGHEAQPSDPTTPPPPPERRRPLLTLQKPDLSANAPILPPRNPLRTSQHEASKLLARTQVTSSGTQFSQLGFGGYELPLTPPASTTSSDAHGDGRPRTISSEIKNPFSDVNDVDGTVKTQALQGSPVRDNFFTRRKVLESKVRPSNSIEWKH